MVSPVCFFPLEKDVLGEHQNTLGIGRISREMDAGVKQPLGVHRKNKKGGPGLHQSQGPPASLKSPRWPHMQVLWLLVVNQQSCIGDLRGWFCPVSTRNRSGCFPRPSHFLCKGSQCISMSYTMEQPFLCFWLFGFPGAASIAIGHEAKDLPFSSARLEVVCVPVMKITWGQHGATRWPSVMLRSQEPIWAWRAHLTVERPLRLMGLIAIFKR